MHKYRLPAAVAAFSFMVMGTGCGGTKSQAPVADWDKLVDDFVYGSLALSPVSATSNGYHQHNGASLDEALDDWSPAGVDAARKFYQGFDSRLAALDQAAFDKEQRVPDIGIVRNSLSLALLSDLNEIQSYKHNPTTYVELDRRCSLHALRTELRTERAALRPHYQAHGKSAGAVGSGQGEPGRFTRSVEQGGARRERWECRVDR